MSVLVNTKNEQEEKVLLAFLDSLQYNYEFDIDADKSNDNFIHQYNIEIEQADLEIENGDFFKHEDVEKLLSQRRKVS